MRRGFTLVELSIVLVIIGLLIGGILVAQSMIETARIQRLTRDISKYEIAINNFKVNYKYYPGDDNFFTPPGGPNEWLYVGDLNGNHIADDGTLMSCMGAYSGNEKYQLWGHLSQAKMIDANYPPLSPSGFSNPAGNCFGTHSSSDLTSGKFWPHTDLSGKAAIYYGSKTYIIQPSKGDPQSNLSLFLIVNSGWAVPLEQKLGAAGFNNTGAQTGLVDAAAFSSPGNALGYCSDPNNTDGDGDNLIKCTDSNAVVGFLYYYLAPI